LHKIENNIFYIFIIFIVYIFGYEPVDRKKFTDGLQVAHHWRRVSVAFKSTEISVPIPEYLTDYKPIRAIRFVVPSRCAEIAMNSCASAANV